MGLLNYRTGSDSVNPTLRHRYCILCLKQGIQDLYHPEDSNTFDYTCSNCGPDVIISIPFQVFLINILESLKANENARNAIREDISHLGQGKYSLDSTIINYFLNPPVTTGLTFQSWYEGNFSGSIDRITTASKEDRTKIEEAQSAIVKRDADRRFEGLVSDFNHRLERSIAKDKMIDLELSSIARIFDPHGLDYKPTNNHTNKIGNYNFSTRDLNGIREYHQEFTLGKSNFSEVPSDNQRINKGKYSSQLRQMAEAIALNDFQNYLTKYKRVSEKLDERELDSASSKFDEILEEIRRVKEEVKKGFSEQATDIEDFASDQFNRQWESLEGLNLLYEEIEDLKSLLPSLPKKSLFERFFKKVIEKAGTKLSVESVKWLCRRLNIDDTLVDIKNHLPGDIIQFLQ